MILLANGRGMLSTHLILEPAVLWLWPGHDVFSAGQELERQIICEWEGSPSALERKHVEGERNGAFLYTVGECLWKMC